MSTLSTDSINKVASVGIIFWIIKMMSTTVGETGADFLIFKLHWGLVITSLVMLLPLVAVLAFQIYVRSYHHGLYWSAVVLVSIVGTLITDLLTDYVNVPLPVSSFFFSVVLLSILVLWFKQEKTLSIKTINTKRREGFYWAAILITFALGTAVGDWVSEYLNLGYKIGIFLFGGMIVLVAIAHYKLRMQAVISFWMAYILTRPLGASVGDYLSHSKHKGGLGFGTVNTSLIFLVVIFILVILLIYIDQSNSKDSRKLKNL